MDIIENKRNPDGNQRTRSTFGETLKQENMYFFTHCTYATIINPHELPSKSESYLDFREYHTSAISFE